MNDSGPYKSDASAASGTSAASVAGRRRRHRKRSRLRWIVLGVIAVVFGYVYIGGSYGWYNMWKLKEQRSRLQADLEEEQSRVRVLTGELELLEGDAVTDDRTRFELERRAREEHGMVREDELIYRFPAESDSATTDSTGVKTSNPAR